MRVKCPEGWTSWSTLLELMTDNGTGLCEAPDTLYVITGNTDAEIAWNAVNGENRYQIRYRIQGEEKLGYPQHQQYYRCKLILVVLRHFL
ncbi:MAG: hypothetical protein R2784_09790 [Saprospiraceae bacterium]